jgi:hypothetical protein
MLELCKRHPAHAQDDAESIGQDLAISLRELHLGGLRPTSALAWPAYTLGYHVRCPRTLDLVEDILSSASRPYETRGQWTDQGTHLGAMRTYWRDNRVRSQPEEAGRSELEQDGSMFEVGLW